MEDEVRSDATPDRSRSRPEVCVGIAFHTSWTRLCPAGFDRVWFSRTPAAVECVAVPGVERAL